MTKIPFTLRSIFSLAIFLFLISNHLKAQPNTGEFINVTVGYGISAQYYENIDITGNGFYAHGEYVLGLASWFGVRPYAGILLTSKDSEDPTEYEVTAKIFMTGIKGRFVAPIPWVAPFVEIGVGASAGSLVTYTPLEDYEVNGLQLHIPFSFGLSLGPKHNVDIAFIYYFHLAAQQINGAAAFGITFPINNKKQQTTP